MHVPTRLLEVLHRLGWILSAPTLNNGNVLLQSFSQKGMIGDTQ
ncbi:hypothetical protein [Paenibacillus sp. FSL L8-0158]